MVSDKEVGRRVVKRISCWVSIESKGERGSGEEAELVGKTSRFWTEDGCPNGEGWRM